MMASGITYPVMRSPVDALSAAMTGHSVFGVRTMFFRPLNEIHERDSFANSREGWRPIIAVKQVSKLDYFHTPL